MSVISGMCIPGPETVCYHCGKNIDEVQRMSINRKFDVSDYSIVFHMDCFRHVAGDEYIDGIEIRREREIEKAISEIEKMSTSGSMYGPHPSNAQGGYRLTPPENTLDAPLDKRKIARQTLGAAIILTMALTAISLWILV